MGYVPIVGLGSAIFDSFLLGAPQKNAIQHIFKNVFLGVPHPDDQAGIKPCSEYKIV